MTIQWLNINWQLEQVKKWEDFTVDNKEFTRYDLWITIMWGKMLINKFVDKWTEFKLENNKNYSFPISAGARKSTKKTDEKWDPILYVTYKLIWDPVIL